MGLKDGWYLKVTNENRLIASSKPSSEPRDYIVRSSKGMNTSLTLSNKSLNKKKKARINITDITNQYFRNVIKEFKNSPYLGYKNEQVRIEPTED